MHIFKRFVVVVMVAGLLQAVPFATASEDLSVWQKRMSITFSGCTPPGGGTLTNFPALVILNNTNTGVGFNYNDFLSPPYGDLRFVASDNTTPLDFEVESWNTTGLSYVWVRVPELTSNVTIYALWGQSGVAAPASTTNGMTWDGNYNGVWHLAQSNALDSTTNNRTGTAHGNTNSTGRIGTAQGFSGTNSYIDLGSASLIPSNTPWTISGWLNPSNTAAEADFFAQYLPVQNNGRILVRYNADRTCDMFLGNDASHSSIPVSLGTVSSNRWAYFSFSRSGSNFVGYLNGVRVVSTNDTNANRAILQTGNLLGARGNSTNIYNSSITGYFPGFLDEFRVSSVARASNWVWACYMNTASNAVFNNYGAPECPNLPLINNTIGATNMTWSSADLNGTLLATGSAPTTVFAFWGKVDAGTNTWASTNVWTAPQVPGNFTVQVVGLDSNATYYYRFAATNAAGITWAPTSSVFITGDVWIDKLADASEIGPTPGTFTVHRASAATNEALVVNYTVSGTASPGVDYAALSGVTTIPAGTDAVALVVSPYFDHLFEGAETVTVTIASGLYVIGASSSSAMSIADYGIVTSTWSGGGTNALASNPSNWVSGVAPVSGDAIALNTTTNKNMTWDLNIPVQSWSQVGYTGTVTIATVYGNSGFTNLSISGDCIISNGVWTQIANPSVNYESNRLYATIGGNLSIGTGAVIDATAKGYTAGNGPGRFVGTYGGGSYGGRGVGGFASSPGLCYGSIVAPTNLGSGSSAAPGGGTIWLRVGGELNNSGTISANSSPNGTYTGSGGSIYLIAGSLSGLGGIQASAGAGTTPGGGGRIALVVTNAGSTFTNFTGTIQALAGGSSGHAGTIYKEKASDVPGKGELIVNNYGGSSASWSDLNAIGSTTCEFSRITLTNGARLNIDSNDMLVATNSHFVWSGANNGITVSGGTLLVPPVFTISNLYIAIRDSSSTFNPSTSLTVGSNAEFRVDVPFLVASNVTVSPGGNLTHTANGGAESYKVDLIINGSLTIPTGGMVDVTGRGYSGGPGASNGGGGSYGGRGYDANILGTIGPCYGSIVAPTNLGSSGRNTTGGGAIWLRVAGELRNDGQIVANGTSNTTYTGSGGSVYLSAGSLTGAGRITANGGVNADPGGGGRVALVVTNAGADFSTFTGLIQANSGGTSAGGGSIYLRTAAQDVNAGTLIFDNGGYSASYTDINSNINDLVFGDVLIRNGALLRVYSNKTLTISGIWSNRASFSALSGSMVAFTGGAASTSLVYGSTTFSHLLCTNAGKVLMFQNGRTNTIPALGRLTLKGESTSNLCLRSMQDGTAWKLNVSSSAVQAVEYVDVKDSDAMKGTGYEVSAVNSLDSGNNSNWVFVVVGAGETNVWTGGSNTTWSSKNNWSLNRTPYTTDSIKIPAGCPNYPVLDGATTLQGLEIQANATLTLNGYSLTVAGPAAITGTLAATSSESIIFQSGADFAGGTLTASLSSIQFMGDVNFAGGSFAPGLSSVALAGNGDQTVNLGNQDFNKIAVLNSTGTVTFGAGFSAAELRCESPSGICNMVFQQGESITLRDLVLQAATGRTNILLASSAPGSKWNLTVTGYRAVQGVEVSDSDAHLGLPIIAVASQDNGNNTNWRFDIVPSIWLGSSNGNFHTAANWSMGTVPDASTRAWVTATNTLTLTGAVSVLELVVGGGTGRATLVANAPITVGENLVVATNGVLMLNNSCVVTNGLYVLAGGVLSNSVGGVIRATVMGNVGVDVGAVIDVTGRGAGAHSNFGGADGGGGSYGGYGYDAGVGTMGICYGSIIAPTDVGSGGRNCAGGGAIRMEAGGNLRNDGVIYANGALGTYTGSGGSIYLIAGTLGGTGRIWANGGNGGQPGGGGRVSLIVTNAGANFSGFTGTIQANGGGSGAGGGTIYQKTASDRTGRGTVYVLNNAYANGSTHLPPSTNYVSGEADNLTFCVTNGAVITLKDQFTVADITLPSSNTKLDLGLKSLIVHSRQHGFSGSVINYGEIIWIPDVAGTVFSIR